MNTLFVLALLLVCPLMMMWMMRGMHGASHASHDATPVNLAGNSDRRIADLEREVATLRGQRGEPTNVIDMRHADRR